MSDDDDFGIRVRDARLAQGLSQEEVGRMAGTTQSTVERIENGGAKRSRFREEVAIAVGITVRVDDTIPVPVQPFGQKGRKPLPKRESEDRPVPVFTSAEGGDGSFIISNEPVEWAGRPNVLTQEEDLYGVVIEGTSMDRMYRPGDTVWIHPKYRERRDEPCVFRRFNDVTGEASMMIKWLVDFNSKVWKVEQLNPQRQFEMNRDEWPECYRVLGKKNRP